MDKSKQYPRLMSHRRDFYKQNKLGSLLDYRKLDDSEKIFLAVKVFRAIRLLPNRDPYQLFSELLYNWGIMCPHPNARRRSVSGHYACDACGAYVLDFGQLTDDDDVAPLVSGSGKAF